MSITRVRHVFAEPDAPPSELHIEFDREITEREASELAQAVQAVHERHEAARSFDTNPHHVRHLTAKYLASVSSETPDLDDDGKPVKHPDTGKPTVTRTFTGTCADCGRAYVRGTEDPPHYVCPSLPAENTPFLRFGVMPCHEGCAIDCGRDTFGWPIGKGAARG